MTVGSDGDKTSPPAPQVEDVLSLQAADLAPTDELSREAREVLERLKRKPVQVRLADIPTRPFLDVAHGRIVRVANTAVDAESVDG